jgi:Suppressor of fused protein (SUFU)
MNEGADLYFLEGFFGDMSRGWRATKPEGVRVIAFDDQPYEKTVTYVTLGLSEHVFLMPNGGEIRQELVFGADSQWATDDFVGLLSYVAEVILREHRALWEGETIPLKYPIVEKSTCRHLYVTSPTFCPNEFSVCKSTDPPTIFAWLIPITDSEHAIVESKGSKFFKEHLVASGTDCFDVFR